MPILFESLGSVEHIVRAYTDILLVTFKFHAKKDDPVTKKRALIQSPVFPEKFYILLPILLDLEIEPGTFSE